MTATETATGPNSREPAMAETQGWQDIATAPKDGTEFLAWAFGNSHIVISYAPHKVSAELWWASSEDVLYHKDAPTHWMPLPKAPGI